MALERKHGLFELDATCRALVETVFERESRGETTVAEDLIEASDMSRATVYRKIKTLTENGALVEAWADHRLTYVIGANVREFCNEIAVKEAAAAAWDKMTTMTQPDKKLEPKNGELWWTSDKERPNDKPIVIEWCSWAIDYHSPIARVLNPDEVAEKDAEIASLRQMIAELTDVLQSFHVAAPDIDGEVWLHIKPTRSTCCGSVNLGNTKRIVAQAGAFLEKDRKTALTPARIKGAPREIAAVDGKNPDENVNYEHYGAEFAKKFNGNPVWNLYVSQSRAALTAVAPLIEREYDFSQRSSQCHTRDEGENMMCNLEPKDIAAFLFLAPIGEEIMTMMSARAAPIMPRLLNANQAATYCGLSIMTFNRLCTVTAIALGDKDDARLHRYDMHELDKWIDSFKAGAAESPVNWLEQLGNGGHVDADKRR
eukprot:gene11869-11957_t